MESRERPRSRPAADDFPPLPESLRRCRPLLHVREPSLLPGVRPVRLLGGRVTQALPLDDPTPAAASPAFDPLTPGAIRTLARDDLLEWSDRLRAAGVSADRRGSPDLSVQLDQVARRPIDVVVCNALDLDPTSSLQADWATRQVESLYAGVLLLTRISGASRCLVVIDGRAATVDFDRPAGSRGVLEPIVRRVRNVYPLADPTVLLYELLKRRLRPGRLPTLAGVLMVDAVAAVDVGRLALAGVSPTHVPFGLVDHRTTRTRNALVPIGSSVADALLAMNVSIAPADLLAGAVLRDVPAAGDDILGPGEVLLHLLPPARVVEPEPCVRCGWCYDVCPVLAHPAGLLEAAQRRDDDLAEHYGLEACVECGLCSQVCPSRLPLLPAIRSLRSDPPAHR